jgi:hypothetical protein
MAVAALVRRSRSDGDFVPDTGALVIEQASGLTCRSGLSPFTGPDDRLATNGIVWACRCVWLIRYPLWAFLLVKAMGHFHRLLCSCGLRFTTAVIVAYELQEWRTFADGKVGKMSSRPSE